MDPGRVAVMKIIEILPEMIEGGVERHLIMLSDQLVKDGHKVMIISAGGKLVPKLNHKVLHWKLPVHKKNPFSACLCSLKIAKIMKEDDWDLIHAHSRVPAWIALWASRIVKKPYIVTAHVNFGNKSPWIYKPYRQADTVICVSNAVEENMKPCFTNNTRVIHNGMPETPYFWKGPAGDEGTRKFLFIGRLSKVKGIQDLVEIFSTIDGEWSLDVLGDGPLMPFLKARIAELGLGNRITLHGFRDDTDQWLRKCSCLLFPSYQEGMPLTLARAIQMKVPVIASDIPPVREMALSEEGLLSPGDHSSWREALKQFQSDGRVEATFNRDLVPSIPEMTTEVESLYRGLIDRNSGRSG